ERSLEDLREMESVKIDIDPDKEEMVPRPDPPAEMLGEADDILENAEPLFQRFREKETSDIVSALTGVEEQTDITPVESQAEEDDDDIDFSEFVPAAGAEADEA
ncbi:MAG: secretion system protein, partial [Halosimplex sp.]